MKDSLAGVSRQKKVLLELKAPKTQWNLVEKKKKERRKQPEGALGHTCMGITEERFKGTKCLEARWFPKLMNDMDLHVQETKAMPQIFISLHLSLSLSLSLKWLKNQKNLERSKRYQITSISKHVVHKRMGWQFLKVWWKKYCLPGILCQQNCSYKTWGKNSNHRNTKTGEAVLHITMYETLQIAPLAPKDFTT